MNSTSAKRGFSFNEILMTTAIGGIVMAVGIPAYQDYVDYTRLMKTVNAFIHTLHQASTLAKAGDEPTTVCSNSSESCGNLDDWRTGALVFMSAYPDQATPGQAVIHNHLINEANITVTANVPAISYHRNGAVTFSGQVRRPEWTFRNTSGSAQAQLVAVTAQGVVISERAPFQ